MNIPSLNLFGRLLGPPPCAPDARAGQAEGEEVGPQVGEGLGVQGLGV